MNRNETSRIKILLILGILSCCIGCDQATKSLATQTLQHSRPHSFLADTVRLEYALNPGGFLSLGSTLPDEFRRWIFIGANLCMLFALAAFLCLKRDLSLAIFTSLAFILAGGIGNLIDRIGNHGLVTDFINVGIGPLRTGVFNVADMAVLFGAIAVGYLAFQSDLTSSTGTPARED